MFENAYTQPFKKTTSVSKVKSQELNRQFSSSLFALLLLFDRAYFCDDKQEERAAAISDLVFFVENIFWEHHV
jgi:hypothetical protein